MVTPHEAEINLDAYARIVVALARLSMSRPLHGKIRSLAASIGALLRPSG